MREYHSGKWGLTLVWGLRASVFPRALALAIPNALIAFLLPHLFTASTHDQAAADNAFSIWAGFTSVLTFILFFRSNVAYNRWWEGGTLLQQTRGEWFNAYSSLIAFTSPDHMKEQEVEAYQHMLARLMSLLFCCALQQVSPNRDRAFEIIDSEGIDPLSLKFLTESNDRVEVILQWIQRSTILNMISGVLPIPPPVMSRAFQEISRGIVNLQNARKIADFPFPFPYAQTSMVMLLIHWCLCPLLTTMMLEQHLAAVTCFAVVFFLWCVNFIALELEAPFGTADNDLPMEQMQIDWNKSLATLLAKRANQPPAFSFDASQHRELAICLSDGRTVTRKRLTVGKYIRAKDNSVRSRTSTSNDGEASVPLGNLGDRSVTLGRQVSHDSQETEGSLLTGSSPGVAQIRNSLISATAAKPAGSIAASEPGGGEAPASGLEKVTGPDLPDDKARSFAGVGPATKNDIALGGSLQKSLDTLAELRGQLPTNGMSRKVTGSDDHSEASRTSRASSRNIRGQTPLDRPGSTENFASANDPSPSSPSSRRPNAASHGTAGSGSASSSRRRPDGAMTAVTSVAPAALGVPLGGVGSSPNALDGGAACCLPAKFLGRRQPGGGEAAEKQ